MHKMGAFTITAYSLFCVAFAQTNTPEKNPVKNNSNELSININLPLFGYLKDISNISIGAEYSWSNGRFGNMSSAPAGLIGFTFNTGINYYFGKKEGSGIYSYKYDGTTYLHAYGGIIYNPCNSGNIRLTTGPSFEIYNGESEFGYGINLSGSFYLRHCRNFGVSPNCTLMKQGSSEAVTAAGVKFNYVF